MTAVRSLMYLVVIVFLLIGVVMMFFQRSEPQVEPPRMVAVAVDDVDTYSVLRPEQLTEKEVSAEEAKGAYLGKSAAVGKMTIRPIKAGDIINDDVAVACEDFRFVCDMSLEITSFPADFDKVVGGQLRRGARVNIYGYRGGQGQTVQPEVRLVATNVWVVDVRTSAGGEVGNPTPAAEGGGGGGFLGGPGTIAGRAAPASILTVAAEPGVVLDIIRVLGAEGFRAWVSLTGPEVKFTPTPTVTPTPASLSTKVAVVAVTPTPIPTATPTLTPTPIPTSTPTLTPTPSPTPLPVAEVKSLQAGYYKGEGENETFFAESAFQPGARAIVLAKVAEAGSDKDLSGAVVDLNIAIPSGQVGHARVTTDSNGEARYEYEIPRRGSEGDYEVAVERVRITGYEFGGAPGPVSFVVSREVVSPCGESFFAPHGNVIGDHSDNFDYNGTVIITDTITGEPVETARTRPVPGKVVGTVNTCLGTAMIEASLSAADTVTDSLKLVRHEPPLTGNIKIVFETTGVGVPEFLGDEVVLDTVLFGDMERAPRFVPEVKVKFAGWGKADVEDDGEIVQEDLNAFFMYTEGLTRNEMLQILRADGSCCYDPNTPGDFLPPNPEGNELHLWVFGQNEPLDQIHNRIWLNLLYRPVTTEVPPILPTTGGTLR